jgi:SAM-dependent methyltransferase
MNPSEANMPASINIDMFICPKCGGGLTQQLKCSGCQSQYSLKDGIMDFFIEDGCATTNKMLKFYEQYPFPNYNDAEDVGALIEKSERGIFARLLNEQIPVGIKVLEVGCGTGQLSNFLGVYNRDLFGTDMNINSLKLGEEFRKNNKLDKVSFYRMNLFYPCFKKESFPLVICSGVLHHTERPKEGFRIISNLVKKNGYIIIGLYSKYGRLWTDLRRLFFNITNDRFKWIDPVINRKDAGDNKKEIWFKDQYRNPHESKHSIGEALKWFHEYGFEYINSIPKITGVFSENEKLFKKNNPGNPFDRFICQFNSLIKEDKQGGYFIMIGRKI